MAGRASGKLLPRYAGPILEFILRASWVEYVARSVSVGRDAAWEAGRRATGLSSPYFLRKRCKATVETRTFQLGSS
jgi:hypothetical protein